MKSRAPSVMIATAIFGVSAGSGDASAQMCPAGVAGSVCQPTGEIMPQPVGLPEIGVVSSRGFPTAPINMSAITLEGLFFYRGETLDPVRDAHITPGVFSPKCGFTGQLVLRGGGCNLLFGWYNVTAGSTTPPPNNQIYPLVPADPKTAPPMGLGCMDGDFCPLATMMTTQPNQHTWTPTTFSAANIRSDPNYKGGLIGFAIVGNTATSCAQTKFSQAELNTKQASSGKPWITTLVWQSTVNPDAYYIGFEDLPLTPVTWKGQGGAFVNDGDFNDFVYYITGLNCDGGGKPCNTGMPGVCADGTTQCVNGGTIICKPNVGSSAEICDGQDNSCDGMVDEGNPCPGVNQICDRGVCVNKCNDTEFPCSTGLLCDESYCKDPACIGKTCPAGQICVRGGCQGGCDGVVCPGSKVCRVGRCIDPCEGVDCTVSGGICENGACVSLCSCRECTAGKACASDGHCVDPGCDKMTCGAGMVCRKGACQDACTDSKCPANQACSMGNCLEVPPSASGGTVGTVIDAGATGGIFGGTGGRSGAGAAGGEAGSDATGNGVAKCGCDVTGLPAGALSLLTGVLAFGLLLRRRSRS